MAYIFRGNYKNRPKYEGELNDGEILVETAGFITMKERIDNILFAGQSLERARAEQFDFMENEVDDNRPVDPMREPSLDLAEASMLLNKVQSSIQQSVESSKAATAAKKTQKTTVEEQTPSSV